MAQHNQGGGYKAEPGVPANDDHHHPHHGQQGPPPSQHLNQHPRPSSIVHQQHYQQAAPPQHNPNAYPGAHGLPQYAQGAPGPGGHHVQEVPYYAAQPSPYSTPSATSAETPDIMAASHMQRPFPPISYHTPQSNSPASVASPSGHDQHGRSLYGQPPSHMQQQQPMYYPTQQQQQYPPMPAQGAPSPYAQHPQQHNQMATSQPAMIMSHPTGQHPGQHPMQQHQPGMTQSPRTKMEHLPQQQMQRPPPGPLGPPQQQYKQENGPPMNQNNVPGSGVNPNAAPGPIPATTPLVVRQDGNGVQWIAFEYSRDRVKMEYTIRCDVESVNVDTLSPDFKTENCVYPRACCSKDQYRGNRLVYETECNTVGWALAELNPCLRGKRGLIQRAVDSWRNSNQDPRLRSRRVRRMAKINTRKQVQTTTHPHMPGPGGPGAGMPPSGQMGPGNVNAGNMGKPGPMGGMGGPQLHHHHAHPDGSGPGDDGSGDGDSPYADEAQTHHHHQAPSDVAQSQGPQSQGQYPGDVRQAQAFAQYPGGGYPAPSNVNAGPSAAPNMHAAILPPGSHRGGVIVSHSTGTTSPSAPGRSGRNDEELESAREVSELFGDIPEAKKRKFILVEDPVRGGRTRVRVTLDTIDTRSIPDSYRRAQAVWPRSWFAREMQSPTSDNQFGEDFDDEGAAAAVGPQARGKTMVRVPMPDGGEYELGVPRMGKQMRGKEIRVNDLGYRMAWHQSRTFAGRIVFLQRSLDCYRNKVRGLVDENNEGEGAKGIKSHWETRAGKKRWLERAARGRGGKDE